MNRPSWGDDVTVTHFQCFIDGPYGTSSREIFDSDHAVLVASGIGVTPYASILQSIMHRYTASKMDCPHCQKVIGFGHGRMI